MSGTLREVLQDVKVRDISEIEDFRFHDLRHAFATRLIQNGVDIHKVKELLGHKTLAMTMCYSHHCPESLRDSVEVLDICYNSATRRRAGLSVRSARMKAVTSRTHR